MATLDHSLSTSSRKTLLNSESIPISAGFPVLLQVYLLSLNQMGSIALCNSQLPLCFEAQILIPRIFFQRDSLSKRWLDSITEFHVPTACPFVTGETLALVVKLRYRCPSEEDAPENVGFLWFRGGKEIPSWPGYIMKDHGTVHGQGMRSR